jgi:hypothetical protein
VIISLAISNAVAQLIKALLKAGRSWVRFPKPLGFFIDIILLAALMAQGSTKTLTQVSTRIISLVVKAAGE